ncbi:MAG: hypothetical protein RLN70_04930, partial [Rhodospirillaceae bacterium]
ASDQNGAIEQGLFFAVVVTALDELLLGIRPMPEGNPADASALPLNYLSMRTGVRSTARAMGSLMSRRVAPGPGITVRKAQQVALRFTGAYTLDGELYEARDDQTLTLDGSKRLPFIRIPKHAYIA